MKKSREERIIHELVRHFKAQRLEQNLSQNKLALKAGVTRPAISQIESGKRNPTLLVCIKIAHALGKNLGNIIAMCEQEMDKK